MILWTIQTVDWYEELRRAGVIIGEWKFVDQDWLAAYQWMSSEMKKRMGGKSHSSSPIWAWSQFRNGRPRPDLRRSWHLPRGTPGVRIEFQADAADVLLSDFQKWHAVLNGWYLARNEDESNWWNHESPHLSERDKLTHIRMSWGRIFEIANEIQDDFWNGAAGPQIQACVWSLKKSDIVEVTHFVAR